MSALDDLIAQVADPALRARLETEASRALAGKKFGLVFEDHFPDATRMPGVPIRRGTLVAPRGEDGLFRVLRVAHGTALCTPDSPSADGSAAEAREMPVADLVAVARPGEAIHPCLVPMDLVERGGVDAPWHALIEADNAHALLALQYAFAGRVDCIYIDPPYNTGARDWKYNNDYVDENDAWRHSKWLSMMRRRLLLAKKLLNPADSVMIVTIDEKEYLHLGCLLEELFPESRMQMVTDVISSHGSWRDNTFARCNEYLFYLFFGKASLFFEKDDMLHSATHDEVRWDGLVRRGATGKRTARPNLFYPIFFNKSSGKYAGIGESLPLTMNREDAPVPDGCFAVFPISSTGAEGAWGASRETFLAKKAKGYIRFGKWDKVNNVRSVHHLQSGPIEAIETGLIPVIGNDEDGAVILGSYDRTVQPMSVWFRSSHTAGDHGASLLQQIMPERKFPYPKSLYSVYDAIRFCVAGKPDALILDFFAGSGTTLHAVNLLNAADGGRRRCVMVTNNEVSEAEARALSARGLKPGDEAWEALGIARHVTWPRTVCSIEGHDVNGRPLEGDYGVSVDDFEEDGGNVVGEESSGRPVRGKRYRKAKRQLYSALAGMRMADGFRANAAFFRLSFLDGDSVALGKELRTLLPLLWLKAGGHGAPPRGGDGSHAGNAETNPCPECAEFAEGLLLFPENRFAVLTDERAFPRLKEAMTEGGITTAFLATDDAVAFRAMARSLGRSVRCFRLYRDYLDHFRMNRERV